MQKRIHSGIDGHAEDFGLPDKYPWLIESRRAVQARMRKYEADLGSPLASSEAFSEQVFCASSAGLLGLFLAWEKHCKSHIKQQTAAHLLHDWLGECLVNVKINGFSRWKPPEDPPPCQSPETHGGIRKAKTQKAQ